MVVPKKNGTVRLCGDYKVSVNQALVVDQYPLPKPSDLFATLAGGKWFTKLDLAQAYTQMELDEESRQYVAFNTHHGLYQYLRLPFGIASAPAVFPPSLSPQQAEMLDPPEQFRVEGTTGDVCNALDQLMGAVRDLVSTYCSSFCTSYRPTWLLPEENKETVSIGTQTQSLRLRAAAVHRLYLTDCAKYVCGGVCVWGYVCGGMCGGVCVGSMCVGYVWGAAMYTVCICVGAEGLCVHNRAWAWFI